MENIKIDSIDWVELFRIMHFNPSIDKRCGNVEGYVNFIVKREIRTMKKLEREYDNKCNASWKKLDFVQREKLLTDNYREIIKEVRNEKTLYNLTKLDWNKLSPNVREILRGNHGWNARYAGF